MVAKVASRNRAEATGGSRLMYLSEMKPMDLGFSMPAEWAPHSGCWMGWPKRESIWHGHMEAARDDYARVAQAIARFEPVTLLADPLHAQDASSRCGPSVRETCSRDIEYVHRRFDRNSRQSRWSLPPRPAS